MEDMENYGYTLFRTIPLKKAGNECKKSQTSLFEDNFRIACEPTEYCD